MYTVLIKTLSLRRKITYFYDNNKSFKMGTLSLSHFTSISRNTLQLSHSCMKHGKFNCSPDQMHSTTRREGGGGGGSSETAKCAMPLQPYKQNNILRNIFRRQYILCGSGHISKNIANPSVLSEFTIGQTRMKLGRSRRGATAVALREGGNNNVTLESKCFVTVTVQTNSNLCTTSYRAERYKLQRNSA
jgi:hypothetical protein